MVAAVAITRKDCAAEQLRDCAKRTKDADAARRMLALALVLEGKSRTEAATSCGMDRQILCGWVHRYNAEGITERSRNYLPSRNARWIVSGELRRGRRDLRLGRTDQAATAGNLMMGSSLNGAMVSRLM
jgi:Homeodomain-like domain